jgi:hypothetical protein
MLRLELQGREDEEIERALNQVDGLDKLLPMIIDNNLLPFDVDNQGD